MLGSGIIELDVHGMNVEQAKKEIDSRLRQAGAGVYRLRIIHGYHGGTGIKGMIAEEYGFRRHEKVKRIQGGNNQGITELILREY